VDTRDQKTVEGFGREWRKFDHTGRPEEELRETFSQYFRIFPWDSLPPDAVGFDLGCGTGRWARFVAPRVGTLFCIEASEDALRVATRNLAGAENCRFILASAGDLPLREDSMDFGYALGVLHHTVDPLKGIRDCVAKLKPGGVLLLYLYYALDNRPRWYRLLWRGSDLLRRAISRSPWPVRYGLSQVFAAVVYYPVARTALVAERLGVDVSNFPLTAYRSRSFYTMRNDALDRFGTRLERRFTAAEVRGMMEQAGLDRIEFADGPPYWSASGRKPAIEEGA
jgi:SAM-dependent methyltransferase